MCGGTVRLFVAELTEQPVDPLHAVVDALDVHRPVALATVLDGELAGRKIAVEGERTVGQFGLERLDRSVRRDALGCLDQGLSTIRGYSSSGEVMGSDIRVYIQGFARPPQMVIFGAIDFSVAVAALAREVGYQVTICDARRPFISSSRFSNVADVAVDWPDDYLATRELGERDAVLVFTHDSKFDEPALIAAMESGAGYIGALGSRRTHEERLERLRERGVTEGALARISAPCGLDIGARTPAETAISVLAEILTLRAHRTGERLAATSGPIHPRHARPT
jgi:xanthine dehydrogenase accessory factor